MILQCRFRLGQVNCHTAHMAPATCSREDGATVPEKMVLLFQRDSAAVPKALTPNVIFFADGMCSRFVPVDLVMCECSYSMSRFQRYTVANPLLALKDISCSLYLIRSLTGSQFSRRIMHTRFLTRQNSCSNG